MIKHHGDIGHDGFPLFCCNFLVLDLFPDHIADFRDENIRRSAAYLDLVSELRNMMREMTE